MPGNSKSVMDLVRNSKKSFEFSNDPMDTSGQPFFPQHNFSDVDWTAGIQAPEARYSSDPMDTSGKPFFPPVSEYDVMASMNPGDFGTAENWQPNMYDQMAAMDPGAYPMGESGLPNSSAIHPDWQPSMYDQMASSPIADFGQVPDHMYTPTYEQMAAAPIADFGQVPDNMYNPNPNSLPSPDASWNVGLAGDPGVFPVGEYGTPVHSDYQTNEESWVDEFSNLKGQGDLKADDLAPSPEEMKEEIARQAVTELMDDPDFKDEYDLMAEMNPGEFEKLSDKDWNLSPDSEYMKMAGMDPESGFMKQNSVENMTYNAKKQLREERDFKARNDAEEAAAEFKERYGVDEKYEKRRADYIEGMNKILKKQQIMMVLGAISGDPNVMRLAAGVAEIGTQKLNLEYGDMDDKRLQNMQQSLYFDSEGNYDPPESQEELMRALNQMGATQKEITAITGGMSDMFEEPAQIQVENVNTGQTARIDADQLRGLPPEWVKVNAATGGSYGEDNVGSKTGAKGAQAEEILSLRSEYDTAIADGDTKRAAGLKEQLEVKSKLYGLIEKEGDKDLTQSTTHLNKKLDTYLKSIEKLSGGYDWGKLEDMIGKPPGGGEWNSPKFIEWFENEFMKSQPKQNNRIDPASLDTDSEPQPAVELTREQARAQVGIDNPSATPEQIEKWLDDNGY
jgi:hypothetical protein